MKFWAKSKILMSSIVLFIIGLAPFVDQIKAILPTNAAAIAGVVLPIVILAARIWSSNPQLVSLATEKENKAQTDQTTQ